MTLDGSEPVETVPSRPSLSGRIAAGLRRGIAVPRMRGGAPFHFHLHPVTFTLALLIATGPLATTLGAKLLANVARTEAARLKEQLAPRLATERRRTAARAMLAQAVRLEGPAQVLDRLAATLPAEAALVRAERTADGVLEMEISTGDPDALRAALHRAPGFAQLRDVRQRESDGRMVVLMRQPVS